MKRVLVCEDNRDIATLIKLSLRMEGYQVRTLAKMDDFLDDVIDYGPDVILMDLRMPVLGGEQAVEVLRADERTSELPIILLSANAYVRDIAESLDLPYLTKPFEINSLRRAVAAAA